MVRGLRPIVGRIVDRVELLDPHLLHETDAGRLAERSTGQRIRAVARRGKWVLFRFEPVPSVIVIQPRMTGGFFLSWPDRTQHIRLILHFRTGPEPRRLWFCDTRRLGKIASYPSDEEAEAAIARSLGPDALDISRSDLSRRLASTSRAIKPALMDQHILAGIGNIYADEILHRARIHPLQPANRLSPPLVQRIHQAIGEVLAEAIAAEGSSFDQGYRTVLGLEGGFLASNSVHRRKGQPCPRCASPIVKERIAGLIGRPTYYCPRCQVLRKQRHPT